MHPDHGSKHKSHHQYDNDSDTIVTAYSRCTGLGRPKQAQEGHSLPRVRPVAESWSGASQIRRSGAHPASSQGQRGPTTTVVRHWGAGSSIVHGWAATKPHRSPINAERAASVNLQRTRWRKGCRIKEWCCAGTAASNTAQLPVRDVGSSYLVNHVGPVFARVRIIPDRPMRSVQSVE